MCTRWCFESDRESLQHSGSRFARSTVEIKHFTTVTYCDCVFHMPWSCVLSFDVALRRAQDRVLKVTASHYNTREVVLLTKHHRNHKLRATTTVSLPNNRLRLPTIKFRILRKVSLNLLQRPLRYLIFLCSFFGSTVVWTHNVSYNMSHGALWVDKSQVSDGGGSFCAEQPLLVAKRGHSKALPILFTGCSVCLCSFFVSTFFRTQNL